MLVWHEDFLVQVLGQQMGGGGLLELAAVLTEGAKMSLRSLLSNGSELLTPVEKSVQFGAGGNAHVWHTVRGLCELLAPWSLIFCGGTCCLGLRSVIPLRCCRSQSCLRSCPRRAVCVKRKAELRKNRNGPSWFEGLASSGFQKSDCFQGSHATRVQGDSLQNPCEGYRAFAVFNVCCCYKCRPALCFFRFVRHGHGY